MATVASLSQPVLDVECGHVAPRMPLVNGALARLVVDGDRQEITQELV